MILFRRGFLRSIVHVAILIVAASSPAAWSDIALAADAPRTTYSFDAVVLRPSQTNGYTHWKVGLDSFSASNMTAQQLILYAYYCTEDVSGMGTFVSTDQIYRLPDWASTVQFDIVAKMDEATTTALSGLSFRDRANWYTKMLQPVLEERFKLRAYSEQRRQPVYLLKVTGQGSKLVKSGLSSSQSSISAGSGQIRAKGYKLDELVANLTATVGRVVIDRTNLAGTYDFQLSWRPEDSNEY